MFDCAHVDSTYDCGCGDNDEEDAEKKRVVEDKDSDLHDEVTGIDMIRGGRR